MILCIDVQKFMNFLLLGVENNCAKVQEYGGKSEYGNPRNLN